MPQLSGFSNNPLQTKEDVTTATRALLQPLIPYFSAGRARIRLPIASGAHFDEVAADLEGYARPLWVVAALLADDRDNNNHETRSTSLVEPWIEGLRNGIDPLHADYWGPIGDWDQRMVEAEIISFALLTAPESFYEPLSGDDKTNLVSWLRGLNGKVMPENNWRWFRVLSNLALIKVCGVEKSTLWPFIQQDLETLESFYISDGWSSDGVWRPTSNDPEQEGTGSNAPRGRHADYYSGSFALQFSQMLYSRFASDLDPDRCSVFRDRAKQFIRSFWSYFDEEGKGFKLYNALTASLTHLSGAPIPFGRSLCYKFAMGGFYAVFAYVGLCDDSDEYASHGAVKGMLLRHLRWWATHSENIFWPDGTLNIGYLYPNMYLSEDYNSPQSPYWALKSLIVVALSGNGDFWSSKEVTHPLAEKNSPDRTDSRDVMAVKPAKQIVCNHSRGKHHFMLSSGQFCVWPMKATQAKYAKFAYSSAFGFSIPTGQLITQIAPDNLLALSKDRGESWAVRWVSTGDTRFISVPITGPEGNTEVVAMVSKWRPWAKGSVEVETTLIPPCSIWPDWHVRSHRIRCSQDLSQWTFDAVEGGFAVDGRRKSDRRILAKTKATSDQPLSSVGAQSREVALETPDSSFVLSSAGASGIVNLSAKDSSILQPCGEILKPDPNTNLMTPRTLLPTIKHSNPAWPTQEVVLMTAVFAVADKHGELAPSEIERRWSRRPEVSHDAKSGFSLK
ncbi:hypothetical protein QQS21_002606 [Conoideocrella luteorostrata]|uniref:DUF2264 domain protein n=1 Tax=Conoideocrella luteorostrata TaxID=1105319 RepID=A0AAJ0CY02_9HYPO|nr:hypothetical protein QQS21_002606 [Conoideocrella luteorostrata]